MKPEANFILYDFHTFITGNPEEGRSLAENFRSEKRNGKIQSKDSLSGALQEGAGSETCCQRPGGRHRIVCGFRPNRGRPHQQLAPAARSLLLEERLTILEMLSRTQTSVGASPLFCWSETGMEPRSPECPATLAQARTGGKREIRGLGVAAPVRLVQVGTGPLESGCTGSPVGSWNWSASAKRPSAWHGR